MHRYENYTSNWKWIDVLKIFEEALKIKSYQRMRRAVALEKVSLLRSRKRKPKNTLMASKHNFKTHFGFIRSNFIKIVLNRGFIYYAAKVYFELFLLFTRHQTYRVFFSIFYLLVSLVPILDWFIVSMEKSIVLRNTCYRTSIHFQLLV